MALIFCPVTQNMSFPCRTTNWPAARTPPLPCTPRIFLFNMKNPLSHVPQTSPPAVPPCIKRFTLSHAPRIFPHLERKQLPRAARIPLRPPASREANFYCSGSRNRSIVCVPAIFGICSRCEAAQANFARRTFSAANKVCPAAHAAGSNFAAGLF